MTREKYHYDRHVEKKYLNKEQILKCEHGTFILGYENTEIHYLFFHSKLLPKCATLETRKNSNLSFNKYIKGQSIRNKRNKIKCFNHYANWNLWKVKYYCFNKKLQKTYSYISSSKLGRYLNKYHNS